MEYCDSIKKEAKKRQVSDNLLYVLLYDYLFGEGLKNCGGKLKKFIHAQKIPLEAALARYKIKMKAKTNEELLPEHIRNPGTFR